MKPVPEVVFGNAQSHIDCGAKSDDAVALARAIMAEESEQEIERIATVVSAQISAAKKTGDSGE